MNVLESYTIDTPFGDIGECSKFTIDDILTPFTLRNVMSNGDQYTISLWVRTILENEPSLTDTEEEEEVEEPDIDTGMSLLIRGLNMPVTNKWTYYSHTFPVYSSDLKIFFNAVGTYYIYHPQLERGNVATDWAESPIDTAERIKYAKETADKAKSDIEDLYIKLEESIQMVVTSINNGTMLEQTDEGWKFVGGGTTDQLLELSKALDDLGSSTNDSITQLKNMVDTNNNLSSYIKIDPNSDPPKINMGVYIEDADTGEGSFGKFSIQITPTALEFLADGDPIAWLSNQELHIRKAVIEDELIVDGFILTQHGTNGNVGFLWKGVSS